MKLSIGMGACYLSVMASFSFSYIYDVRVIKRWQPSYRRYQYVVALGDFHDASNPVQREQRQQIERLLRLARKRDSLAIVEDLTAPPTENNLIEGSFRITSRGGILGGLTSYCQSLRMSVSNVEFRFARVASLGPVFNAGGYISPSLSPALAMNLGALRQEVIALQKTLTTLEQSRQYAQEIMAVMGECDELLPQQMAQQPVSSQLKGYSERERFSYIQKVLTFDGVLLDYAIMQQIRRAPEKELIIVIAGGSHTGHVFDELERQGYSAVTVGCPKMPAYKTKGAPAPRALGLLAQVLPDLVS